MNVLLVWNGPQSAEERSILVRREVEFLQQLEERGVRATVALCGDGGGAAAHLRAAGADVHVLRASLPPNGASLPHLPSAIRELRALIARVQPQVIEATEPMPAIAAGLAARPRRGRRVALYRRQHEGGRRRLLLTSRLAAHLTDRTIVSCEAMRRRASEDDGCALDRIDVATPGAIEPRAVAQGETCATKRTLGFGCDARVIAAVSRLRHEKGLDVLIRAASRLSQRDVHLVIAGTGPEEPHLRELAARSRVPVHFLGHCDDVTLWLHVADVVAIPSRRESFGRLTLEAMAAGRPLVATRVGGLAEAIVDGETGLLVSPDDDAALTAALEAALENRTLAQGLGAAARARFRSRYTIAHMAARRVTAWERALAAAGLR